MSEWKRIIFVDFSPFEMEIITQIPMEKLVYVICEFYWNMGHKKITLKSENYHLYYNPEAKLKYPEKIKKIRVSTRKNPNKQKFDSVYFNFEQIDGNKIKILEHMGFGFKIWDSIYMLIALLLTAAYALRPFTTGRGSMYVFLFLLIPVYIVGSLRIKRIAKHPNVEKYKTEFKEHIRKKEKELFPAEH
jgi:hypothetical protein